MVAEFCKWRVEMSREEEGEENGCLLSGFGGRNRPNGGVEENRGGREEEKVGFKRKEGREEEGL